MSYRFAYSIAIAVFLTISGKLPFALSAEWDQFRGPNGNARSDAKDTAVAIDKSNIRWQTTIPGKGWSSPVVASSKIWITSAETEPATEEQIAAKTRGVQFAKIKTVARNVKLRAICIDAESGNIFHNILLREIDAPELINPLNSYASPTPAIAHDRVICHFGNYGTWCLNSLSGETHWQTKLEVDHSVGPGSSPVIVDDIAIIACDGIDKQFVAGLSLQTGKLVWKTTRPIMRTTNGEFKKAYSTPLLVTIDGKTQAIIPGSQWICAYEPSTGKEIWRSDCGDGFSTTPMAIYESGFLICGTGYMNGDLVGIVPKGTGDISDQLKWRASKGGSKMPTGVSDNGFVYSISDDGILSILEAATGNLNERIRIGGKFASSPLLVSGKLYLGSQEGEFHVYMIDSAGGKPTKIATSQLDGSIMASPGLIGSDLLIRTSKSLIRVNAN